MDSSVGILTFFSNCRICLQIHPEMTSIQSLKGSNDYNLLLTYFNIEVTADFRYPNQICSVCLNQLNNIILFKQKCESSLNYLKSILKDNVFQVVVPFQELNVFGRPIKTEKSDESSFNVDSSVNDNSQKTLIENIKPEKSDNVSCEGGDNLNLPVDIKVKKRFKCDHCEKTFPKPYRKLRHEAAHQKNIFKCDQCPKTFRSQNVLTRHIRIHLGQKPFACTECSRSFSSHSGLAKHKQLNHSDNQPPKTVCKECGIAVQNISVHNQYKHSPHQFECKYCNRKFAFKSVLATHVKNFHENCEETFTILCTLCGKVFRRMSDLNFHNKTKHSDERNYQCKYCDKKFKTCSLRTKHEKIHLNVRRFKCTYCPRAFRQKKTLICHIHTHTGERPFSCKFCEKTFAHDATLGTHIKLVHGRAVTLKK